jgi:hypothetical protein
MEDFAMPRSLANGDYSLVMAIESASRPNSWYRVLADRTTGNLSCDCPSWTFKQEGQAPGAARTCKHTRLAQLLAVPQQEPDRAIGLYQILRNIATTMREVLQPQENAEEHPLIRATRQQWPGLGGQWSIEECHSIIDRRPYRFVLLRLVTGNGRTATGVVAFAERYHPTVESRVAGVAGWAGYAVAAEVARQAGFPMAGQPPEHFKVTRRAGARAGAGRIGLNDILRVGDQVDLGDGFTPVQRAENTLRLFLGEELYGQLERQHFLDVSSVDYAQEQRVYRVRRDPAKQRERRVRIFKRNLYVNDYCIVRAQDVPEADHWLTVFLNLISDEQGALSVVQQYNVFPPHSDDYQQREEETVPAIWQERVA